MKTLLVLSMTSGGPSDRHMATFSARVGASVELIRVGGPALPSIEVALMRAPTNAVIAVEAKTLASVANPASRDRIRRRLLEAGSVFLYGVTGAGDAELVRWLTSGLVSVGDCRREARCDLPTDGAVFTHQLAGSSFMQPTKGVLTPVLSVASETSGVLSLIAVGGAPSFVCVRESGCNLFISTAGPFQDPDAVVTSEGDIEAHYSTLIPLLVFLRAACGDACWRGGPAAANLIIDDPVLRRVYGFLNFATLFESLERYGYAATVAYIPWNHSRTSRRAVSFFREAERFSLCVHGCDHTNNEFGSDDKEYLHHKSSQAIDRMRRHQRRTGIPFEPVMIFPQGRFSMASLPGLRASRFVAAINSTRFPTDLDSPRVFLWELLQPAITRLHGFPVFGRHYVEEEFSLRLDLFLGRPAFMVEHHEFFKSGLPTVEGIVRRLNACEAGLSWVPLSQAVERVCWIRALSETISEVWFFTDRFLLTNMSGRRRTFRLRKEEPDASAVATIRVDGRTAPLEHSSGFLTFETDLAPGASVLVEVEPAEWARPAVKEGRLYAGRVLVRRALSELRDEVLMKHPAILAHARRLARALRASSDSLSPPA